MNGKIWVTSDLHFCHDRDFIYRPRGFPSVEDMNETIIEKWNQVVAPEDEVYILGDLMLNDNKHGIECLKRLNGHKNFIRGNHDTNARLDLYLDEQEADIAYCGEAFSLKYKGYHFYLSHYPTLTSNLDVEKPLKTRVINLCGHVHTSDRWLDWDKGLIYHCELDAHNCYPVLLDTIIEEIKEKIKEDMNLSYREIF